MDGTRVVRRTPFGSNPHVGERGNDTQRRILAAAIDVFSKVGFNDARVELITQGAGCSRPAFYQYFSSKDDVFWKLAGRLGKEMVELGDRLPPVTPDAAGVAALGRWIDDLVALYSAYSPVFSAFQAASRHHRPMARGSRTINDRLGEAVLRSFGAGAASARRTAVATTVVAVLTRSSFYWKSAGGALDRGDLVDGLARLVHRVFFGPISGVNLDPNPAPVRRGPLRAQPPISSDGHPLDHRTRGEQTRRRLLDAGAKVLPARGFHDARVDDIVEVAGVSHGSFYRYFDNKDHFFRVLAEEASTPMIELLQGFPTAGGEAVVVRWLDEWFAAYESNGGVISAWQEMHASEPELVAFSQQVAASVLAHLVKVLEARGLLDPVVEAVALLALIEREPHNVFTLQLTTQADAIAAMVTIVQRGFTGPGPHGAP
jgi:AcrR family transcriptional regulator